jgi:hypothetical protein
MRCGDRQDRAMTFRTIALFVLCYGLQLGASQAAPPAPSPGIKWEVENRFRLFEDKTQFRSIAAIYEGLKTATNVRPSSLQLDTALEQAAIDGKLGPGFGDASASKGWASSVFLHTCRGQPGQYFSTCVLANGDRYLEPRSATLIVSIDAPTAGDCQWLLDGKPVAQSDCLKPATIDPVSYDATHTIEVRPSTADPTVTQIVLKDVLILSMGDSFSSGEGNPELPVSLRDDLVDTYSQSSELGGYKYRLYPLRAPVEADSGGSTMQLGLNANSPGGLAFLAEAAQWTNMQCHRSLYSQHAKAALQYALEHPHLTVTLLTYSCTGASVYEGILNAWQGRGGVAHSVWDDAPQMVRALRDLCKNPDKYEETNWTDFGSDKDSAFDSRAANFSKCTDGLVRQPDALLLSIGGNDVDFAQMIAYAFMHIPSGSPLIGDLTYGVWKRAANPLSFQQGNVKARQLIRPRYANLASALKSYLGLAPYRVVLGAYPDFGRSENAGQCGKSQLGMDVHAVLGIPGRSIISQAESFGANLRSIMATESRRQGWRFADYHVVELGAPFNFTRDDKGRGHGVCAAGPAGAIGGFMTFPTPNAPDLPQPWAPFNPSAWLPYSERNRWTVTPNDAFLTTNYHDPSLLLSDKAQALYAATLSGAFHINALGHAAVADSLLIELRKTLGVYETSDRP